MSIVTFYSYKGGVGRSLAVANVAAQLAQEGHKVLVIDWDLEAPGLEDYFDNFRINADGRGLLFLLTSRNRFEDHIWRLTSIKDDSALDFLPSGRDEQDYYPTLERFSQAEFFASDGGDYLEELRAEWNRLYDYVLIDSRTGLSDAGGVCTIQLPDIVVGMFTATRQSFRGVRDVLELARVSRQNLAYTRPHFSVIPVACRLNVSDESDVDRWMDEFADAMQGLTDDWRPADMPTKDVLWKLRVEHSSALVHGTEIIDETQTGGPAQALIAFQRIAGLIQSDLSDLSGFEMMDDIPSAQKKKAFDADLVNTLQDAAEMWDADVVQGSYDRFLETAKNGPVSAHVAQEPAPPLSLPSHSTHYDVYFALPHGSFESRWVEEFFLAQFNTLLGAALGRDVSIYMNRKELSAVGKDKEDFIEPLLRSSVLLAFFSGRFERFELLTEQVEFFGDLKGQQSVFAIMLSDARLPSEIENASIADFSPYFVTGRSEKYRRDASFWRAFTDKVEVLATAVAGQILDQDAKPS
ncbi:MAG: tyrosine-protein kinase family protein [Roseobacter sp.]